MVCEHRIEGNSVDRLDISLCGATPDMSKIEALVPNIVKKKFSKLIDM